MKVTLQITMNTSTGDDIKTNVGYVNPSANDEKLYELAKKFCSLTKNTFVRADKITVSQINENEGE